MRSILSLVILVASLAGVARAADEPLERAYFATGQSYFEKGRYQDALKEFSEAYRIARRPAFLFNIGVCHERLGELTEAISTFEQYLVEEPNARDRADVEARLGLLRERQRAAALAPTALVAPPPPAWQPDLTSAPPPPRRRTWVWGVVGGAAALVVAAVVVGAVVVSSGDHVLPDVNLR